MVRAVIFDVDGTLVDTVDLHAQAWAEAFAHFGHLADVREVRTQIGKGGDQLMPVFLPASVVSEQGEAIERWRGDLWRRNYLDRATPFPGVRALFERLKADGRGVALGSSCTAEELEAYVARLDIGDLLDGAASGDDAAHSKPFPDIFQAALARLGGVPPGEAVVVGDSPFDAHAAVAAGMRASGVLCGGFPENDLRAAGFEEVHRDPAHLLAAYEASLLGRG